MLLRNLQPRRTWGRWFLALAIMWPAANAQAVMQETESATEPATTESVDAAPEWNDTTSAVGNLLRQAINKTMDPEGLSGTPEMMTPPPIHAEQTLPEKPTQETEAPQTMPPEKLEPRVAMAPETQEETWQAYPDYSTIPMYQEHPQELDGIQTTNQTAAPIANQATYQTPQLRMTTLGPQQANVHRASQFRFRIINDGPIVAEGVNLTIEIEGSGRVISTFPEGGVQQSRAVYYSIGNLAVGEVREYGFEFQADQAGQVSVQPRLTTSSTTRFSAEITAPQVDIDIVGDDTFVVGQQISQRVIIRNNGTETVNNLAIRQACTPSSAFEQTAIDSSQQVIPAIYPGQAREISLSAIAVQQGTANMQVVVEGDNVRGTAAKDLTFVNSRLAARIEGPDLTYLNSLNTWAITVDNDQTRDIEDVQVRLQLPMGMVVKVVDRKADFDPASSSITWTIPRLAAGSTETIPFKATISEFGQHAVKISVGNDAGAMTHAQMNTQAIGRADIDLKVITNPEPIETGSTTSVIVQIQNRGTQPATDVAVQMQLPETIDALESADYLISERQVAFDTFRLEPGQTHNLTVPITCSTSGDHIIRATVQSSASSNAIGAENSLFFFSNSTSRTADRSQDIDR
ncbi:MAG: hypothetical protein ACR2NP_12360 [Pirellulaceae bacterium]